MPVPISRRSLLALGPLVALAAEDKKLETLIAGEMYRGGVPGLSIALIEERGLGWIHAFGVKNAKTKDPVDIHTVFEAASLSKPVVAWIAMQMVNRGDLDLDAPLSKYLPEPYIQGDARLKLITMRRVLSHTTGFPNWRPPDKPLTIEFPPGEKFCYSGEGFVYLQKVLEYVYAKPLEELARSFVFGPLMMTSSSFVWRSDYETRAATGHRPDGQPVPKRKPDEANAASSLHTTVYDYAHFVIHMMDNPAADRMFRPQIYVGNSIWWGLGWGIERFRSGDWFWHWGDNGGIFQCFVMARRDTGKGVVVFTNSGNGLKIMEAIVSEAVGGVHPAFHCGLFQA